MVYKKKKSLTLVNDVVEASPYESPKENEPLPEDLVEEFPEPQKEIVLNAPKPEPEVKKPESKKPIPVAYTSDYMSSLATARATKTCKKFVGKWIDLKVGKTITDDKAVIAHLRAHGLVE
jgi:hypothetical protein